MVRLIATSLVKMLMMLTMGIVLGMESDSPAVQAEWIYQDIMVLDSTPVTAE